MKAYVKCFTESQTENYLWIKLDLSPLIRAVQGKIKDEWFDFWLIFFPKRPKSAPSHLRWFSRLNQTCHIRTNLVMLLIVFCKPKEKPPNVVDFPCNPNFFILIKLVCIYVVMKCLSKPGLIWFKVCQHHILYTNNIWHFLLRKMPTNSSKNKNQNARKLYMRPNTAYGYDHLTSIWLTVLLVTGTTAIR